MAQVTVLVLVFSKDFTCGVHIDADLCARLLVLAVFPIIKYARLFKWKPIWGFRRVEGEVEVFFLKNGQSLEKNGIFILKYKLKEKQTKLSPEFSNKLLVHPKKRSPGYPGKPTKKFLHRVFAGV